MNALNYTEIVGIGLQGEYSQFFFNGECKKNPMIPLREYEMILGLIRFLFWEKLTANILSKRVVDPIRSDSSTFICQ